MREKILMLEIHYVTAHSKFDKSDSFLRDESGYDCFTMGILELLKFI